MQEKESECSGVPASDGYEVDGSYLLDKRDYFGRIGARLNLADRSRHGRATDGQVDSLVGLRRIKMRCSPRLFHRRSVSTAPRFKTKTIASIVCTVAVLLIGGGTAVHGQSALDGFDPNANNTIRAVVVQPDGKILIGGDFTSLAPNGGAAVTRNRIARLNPDGTLDTAFNPNANDDVYAIAVQTDGKIIIGGRFTMIGAQTRNHLARLDAATGAADSFNPNANDLVRCITLQADGKILAGGVFTSAGGQVRNRIVRLDPANGLADTWNANASSSVFSIAIAPGGRIVAGGQFTTIGGQTRSRIARLDAAVGNADTWDPNATGTVTALAVQPDGDVLVGGVFTNIGGQPRPRIARLDGGTGLADAWNPNADVTVFSIAVQSDGKVLVGGEFTNIGGQLRLRIARLDRITGARGHLRSKREQRCPGDRASG